jgi:signal peptidase I
MAKHVLLALLFIMLIGCSGIPHENEYQEDLRLQQEVIRQLQGENTLLREVNDRLRKQVVQCEANASRAEQVAAICKENYPALRDEPFNDIAPETHVPISDILVSQSKVIISVPDLQQGIVAASQSMDPYLDENDVVLEVKVTDPAEIHEEDIIVFQRGEERIIHRVIEIGHDEEGWYARTKGDNNIRADPEKVRFSDVRGLVVGVIY